MWSWIKPVLQALLPFLWGKTVESKTTASTAGKDDALVTRIRRRVKQYEEKHRDGKDS